MLILHNLDNCKNLMWMYFLVACRAYLEATQVGCLAQTNYRSMGYSDDTLKQLSKPSFWSKGDDLTSQDIQELNMAEMTWTQPCIERWKIIFIINPTTRSSWTCSGLWKHCEQDIASRGVTCASRDLRRDRFKPRPYCNGAISDATPTGRRTSQKPRLVAPLVGYSRGILFWPDMEPDPR